MHKTVRQMILGLGTFGTGTALLALEVNPYLLVLADTVVGVGMLFAAGSLTVDDLHLRRSATPVKEGLIDEIATPAGGGPEKSPGPTDSLGKLGGALGHLGRGKEQRETRAKEIDKMLDTTLAGQSRRLISLAEGQGAVPGAAGATAGAPKIEEDLLQGISGGAISDQFPGDEADEEDEMATPARELLSTVAPGSGAAAGESGRATEGARADVLSLSDAALGSDDLLSALRLEAMREKKKDDTSLLRNLKGVRVTGRQLLDELDSLVREMRGR
ncbi:MAG TPA: hypothetical protein VKO45_01885 [Methanomicrobiales archaeon]|nr:hypothetical protein [Methanomicrobiales archaeon]